MGNLVDIQGRPISANGRSISNGFVNSFGGVSFKSNVQITSGLYADFLNANSAYNIPDSMLKESEKVVSKLVELGFINYLNIPQINTNDSVHSIIGSPLIVTGGGNGSRWDSFGRLVTGLPNNRPRYTYDPVTGKYEGVWVERESNNLINFSNNINSNIPGIGGQVLVNKSVISSNNTSPSLEDISELIEATPSFSTSLATILIPSAIDNSLYTFSAFQKTANWNRDLYRIYDKGGGQGSNVHFDFTGGIKLSDNSNIGTIEKVSAGFFRASIIRNVGTGSSNVYVRCHDSVTANFSNGATMFTYGYQIEQGSLTSFIKTNGSSLTRTADTYTASVAITGSTYTLFRILNGNKIADYYNDGNRHRYINGVFDSTIVEAPSNNISISSTGSDKLLCVAVREGTITENELTQSTIWD